MIPSGGYCGCSPSSAAYLARRPLRSSLPQHRCSLTHWLMLGWSLRPATSGFLFPDYCGHTLPRCFASGQPRKPTHERDSQHMRTRPHAQPLLYTGPNGGPIVSLAQSSNAGDASLAAVLSSSAIISTVVPCHRVELIVRVPPAAAARSR